MRMAFRYTLLFTLFIAFVMAGFGGRLLLGEEADSKVAATVGDTRSHDFGTVRAGEIIEHTFSLVNSGREPLHIEQVQSSCGCTVAGVESKSVPSGGSVLMLVTLNTKGRAGKLTQSVSVIFSGDEARTYTLSGFVVSDELKPVELGTVLRGDVSPRVLNLPWPTGQTLVVEEVHFNRDKLDVQITPGDKAHSVSIALRDDVPYGLVSESVALHTNDPLAPEKSIVVRGMVSQPVVCEPPEVTLGLVQADKPGIGSARIVSPYAQPVRISSVEHREGQTVTWREERKGDSEVLLHLSVAAEADRTYYKSVLRVNAVAGEEAHHLDIEVYGVGAIEQDAGS